MSPSHLRRWVLALGGAVLAAGVAGTALTGCGEDKQRSGEATATQTVATSRVEVVKGLSGDGRFDPGEIYKREAPGVVTVISEFPAGVDLGGGGGGVRGQGSGFVVSGSGEIATNAHVVTDTTGTRITRARHVYVQFRDGNQVPARIVGADPNADFALLKVSAGGLTLRPLPLGSSAGLVVGSPVAAIGSPFDQPQSLSVGVISGTDRTIDSLTNFSIPGGIQTDAAINRGNSGGPLVDARGRVVGVNSQIRSTSGGGEGVGFAVPIDMVKRSLEQLRRRGRASYAYLGVSTVGLFPQLAARFGLPVQRGVWVQTATRGAPARRAGVRGGSRPVRFQSRSYRVGGDVIVKVGGATTYSDTALSKAIAPHRPGQTIEVELYRGGKHRTLRVKLGERPLELARDELP